MYIERLFAPHWGWIGALFCYENLPPEGRNDPARPEGRLKDSISCWFRRNRAGHQVPSQCFQAFQVTMYFSVPIKRIVIVRAQITKWHVVSKHVVYGD